jgi:hypothetical protein
MPLRAKGAANTPQPINRRRQQPVKSPERRSGLFDYQCRQ